tara:strand:- start:45893 stop:46420 length:528 start_codon:yes stop_codon:yes gene_type:complete
MAVQNTDLVFYKSLAAASGDSTPSCGGAIDGGSPLSATLHDLFDVIGAAEANGSNRTEYRLIYVRNDNSTDTLFDAFVDILTDSTSPDTTMAIGLDPAGYNTASSITLVDEIDSTNLLSGVSFVTAGSDLSVGDVADNDLANGHFRAIWIRRALTTPAASTPADTTQLRTRGETA